MAKTLLYRLFSVGKLPTSVLAALTQEGILLVDEGVPASATYRNFRAPGRRSGWRWTGFTAAIALTQRRLLALAYTSPIIDIALTDQRIRDMRYTLEAGPRLCVAFDAGLFHADWSGRIEYRFRTPQAQQFLELMQPHAASS
jgi:hypothetical protein